MTITIHQETSVSVAKPEWMDDRRVKCKGVVQYMYPNNPSSEVALAKALCNGLDGDPPCPLRLTCLKYAIDHHESYGVWGGTSERDRRKIQRARNKFKSPHIYTMEDVRFPTAVVLKRRVVTYVTFTTAPRLRDAS